jgi:hypothetical protein
MGVRKITSHLHPLQLPNTEQNSTENKVYLADTLTTGLVPKHATTNPGGRLQMCPPLPGCASAITHSGH